MTEFSLFIFSGYYHVEQIEALIHFYSVRVFKIAVSAVTSK